jgi:uncharacterized membrane protein YhiD involved in acid resistance
LETQNIFVFEVTPIDALVNISFALLCGIIIAFVYRKTYRGVNYSANNVIAILMLAMITSLVIIVIGSNLARAFGLVGAMSIVRFRTAVKDTQDIMFIFFALAAGLACGAGMYMVGLTGTMFIGAMSWLAVLIHGENPRKREYLLQVYVKTSDQNMGKISSSIQSFARKVKLVNVKTIGEDKKDLTELTYYITFKRKNTETDLLEALNRMDFVQNVNLYFDED